jgi:hypothetical protein
MPRSSSNLRLRSSSAPCSSGVGASRRDSDMSPRETLDGLAVTTISLPVAPTSVAARSRQRWDGGESSNPTNRAEGTFRHRQPRNGRSTSHVHVAGGSLAGNDHSLISSTLGRVAVRTSSPVGSVAAVGSCGSPGCVSRMLCSLILTRCSHNGVGTARIPEPKTSGRARDLRAMVSGPTRCSWWPSSTSPVGSTRLDGDADRTGELDQE